MPRESLERAALGALGLWLLSATAVAQDPEVGEESAEGESSAEAEASAELGGDADLSGGLGFDDDGGDGDHEDDAGVGGRPDEGVLRFGLDIVILDVANQSLSNDANGDISATDINFGIRNSQLGALGAYRLNPEMQVGVRLGLNVLSGSDTAEPPPPAMGVDVSRSGFELGLLPFFEYMFDVPGEGMRLFALGTLGIRSVSSSSEVDGAPGETSVSGTVFIGGAGGGVHYFLTDDISLDPTLEFTFGTGSQTEEVAGGMPLDSDITGFAIALRVGMSGWM